MPNNQLRHIRLENNENKSVTHSRDTQEVPYNQGVQVLRIIHSYKHESSIFDDFQHYENLQKLEDNKKSAAPPPPSSHSTINKYNQNGPIQFSNEKRPQHNYFNRVCLFLILILSNLFYILYLTYFYRIGKVSKKIQKLKIGKILVSHRDWKTLIIINDQELIIKEAVMKMLVKKTITVIKENTEIIVMIKIKPVTGMNTTEVEIITIEDVEVEVDHQSLLIVI